MPERRWIALTMVTIGLAVAANLAFCCIADPYGLFRDPVGRKLSVYFADRKAKFFMSKRYVPANFDGLLVGPSSSSNWNLSGLPIARIYNESVLGGNASEQRKIAEQTFYRGHFRIALCVLAPKMTSAHEMNDGLDRVATIEALGSIHVFVNAAAAKLLAMHRHIGKTFAPPNGTRPIKEETILDIPVFAQSSYVLDRVAVRDYRELILSLRERGAAIVYVVPPVYEPCYEKNRTGLTDYLQRITKELPAAPLIDFNSAGYASFRSQRPDFVDCLHLNAVGAARASELLIELIPDALATYQANRPETNERPPRP